MKKCSKCEIKKDISEFHKEKQNKDGLRNICKSCVKKYQKIHREKNIDKIRAREKKYNKINKIRISEKAKEYRSDKKESAALYSVKYRKENSEELRKKTKQYRIDNLEKVKAQEKASRIKNKTKKSERDKQYRLNNKEKISNSKKENQWKENKRKKERWKNDQLYRLSCMIRNSIKKSIKNNGGRKIKKTIELIGCTIPEVRKYIESKFLPGMTWKNHSTTGWHIDHIRPCASFDLTDQKQQKICFNFKNLQPLWARDNLSKNSFYNGELHRIKKAV